MLFESIKRWYLNTMEKNSIRRNTLGSLLYSCIFLPIVIYTTAFIIEHYGWKEFLLFFLIIVFLSPKVENVFFHLLGQYSMKKIKEPYYSIFVLIVMFTFMFFIFGIFQ